MRLLSEEAFERKEREIERLRKQVEDLQRQLAEKEEAHRRRYYDLVLWLNVL